MSGFVLGIDGGGTSTRAALVGFDGRLLAVGQSGTSNYDDVGVEVAQRNIDLAVAAAASQAGVNRKECAAVFLGMAGVTSDADREHIRQIARNLALAPEPCIGVDHDCRAALAGGLEGRPGIVQIAGTGTSCYGRNAAGESWMAGGRGHLVADEGSGYWLGVQAMRVTVMEYDGRLPMSPLHDRVLAALGIHSVEDILHRLHVMGMSRAEIAALAPLVLEAAAAGEPAAVELLERGAAEMAACVAAVARKLGFAGRPFEVCLVGGLTQAGEVVTGRLQRAILRLAPEADVKPASLPPALGAALLALEMAGQPADARMVAQLRAGM